MANLCLMRGRPRRAVATTMAIGIVALGASTAKALSITPSWNGYKWARTGDLAIKTVNNTTSIWQPYFSAAITGWSQAGMIDLVPVTGTPKSATGCSAVFGTIQVCNASYGFNGWLGYANVWTSGGFIVQATVKLNDSYYASAKYNTSAWRMSVMCQEVGHTIGLNHNNGVKTDVNTGTCMDYSNNPAGGGTWGAANLAPGEMDFAGLNIIYKDLNSTQLTATKPQYVTGTGTFIEGWHDHDHDGPTTAVPEPSSWALLIAGFGLVGAIQRRRDRPKHVAGRLSTAA